VQLQNAYPKAERFDAEVIDLGQVERESASSVLVVISAGRRGEHGLYSSLDVGPDDLPVILLPLHELVVKVCTALKSNRAFAEVGALFKVGDLRLDVSRHLVQKRGCPLHLTPKEFTLLHHLMMNAGKPVSHLKLFRSIWGSQYGCKRAHLRILVRQLRLKIEDNPTNPKYLLTEASIGYRFVESLEMHTFLPASK
jgi:two-component system, OmpR family, KDP operon response regulator KdpE